MKKAMAMARQHMPILGDAAITKLPFAAFAHREDRAMKNHNQTLERLAQRGGLCLSEALAILEDRPLPNGWDWEPAVVRDKIRTLLKQK